MPAQASLVGAHSRSRACTKVPCPRIAVDIQEVGNANELGEVKLGRYQVALAMAWAMRSQAAVDDSSKALEPLVLENLAPSVAACVESCEVPCAARPAMVSQ